MTAEREDISDADRKKVLRRLKKILALTESSNPGEAAAAMQQANTLMQRYGFSSMDAQVADVQEVSCDLSGAEIKKWESSLVGVVASSMGVLAMQRFYNPIKGMRRSRASIIFVGENSRAQIAAYAFEALRKKLRAATKESFSKILYEAIQKSRPDMSELEIKDRVKDMKLTTKQRDAYAFAWCNSIRQKVSALAPSVAPCVTLYIESKHTVKPAEEEKKAAKRTTKADPLADYMRLKGREDGLGIDLYQGVSQAEAAPQIECERERMRG